MQVRRLGRWRRQSLPEAGSVGGAAAPVVPCPMLAMRMPRSSRHHAHLHSPFGLVAARVPPGGPRVSARMRSIIIS